MAEYFVSIVRRQDEFGANRLAERFLAEAEQSGIAVKKDLSDNTVQFRYGVEYNGDYEGFSNAVSGIFAAGAASIWPKAPTWMQEQPGNAVIVIPETPRF